MSRKALEMELLCLHTDPVRVTWCEDSYTEDSDRHVLEGFENGEFLFIGLHKGNLRHLQREGLTTTLVGVEPVLDTIFCSV